MWSALEVVTVDNLGKGEQQQTTTYGGRGSSRKKRKGV
tara:strand:- start:264 stop:377 length:114 start_codon:yes stop_codon:yes gene_type:complete